MQVNWQRFLGAMGCVVVNTTTQSKQPCPLHPHNEPSLQIQHDPLSSHWRFLCLQPRCGFYGDAVILVSRKRGITLEQAVDCFRPGGDLYSTLEYPLLSAQLDDYLKSHSSQTYIAEYVGRCQQALRMEGSLGLRMKMAEAGAVHREIGSVHDLPQALGALVYDEIPLPLQELRKIKYRKGLYAFYPYTFEGVYTSIQIQNFLEPHHPTCDIAITRSDVGIFMEDEIKNDTVELVVPGTALAACTVRHNVKPWLAKPPVVVHLAGFPIPFRYAALRQILLISFSDVPITLKTALQYHVAESHVEGQTAPINITVLNLPFKLSALCNGTDELAKAYMNRERTALLPWIVQSVSRLLTENRSEEIYNAFNSVHVNMSKRADLVTAADKAHATPEVIRLLQTINVSDADQLVLANGCAVRRTPAGLQAIRPANDSKTLCNIMLDVTENIVTPDGLDYVCKLQLASSPQVLSYRMRPRDTVSAKMMARAVKRCFNGAGVSAYVAFYDYPGYAWSDILAKMSEGKPISEDLLTLSIAPEVPNNFYILPDNRQSRVG